ncbi:MAG: hypothetical protein IPG45_06385 [Deltaproteobacteria bacterium]|nr:hypothetical protein [Deltaproteobacteria bacterium]
MKRLFLLAAGSLMACSNYVQDLTITFPSVSAQQATSTLTYLAFEPLLPGSEQSDVPRFVGCGEVGVFPPARLIDPDSVTTFPNLEVLQERVGVDYPIEGDWDVRFRKPKVDPKRNPWGLAMVYLEARGEVRAPQEQGGGMVTATLLAGCYCVRTVEATHPNSTLDAAVKKACELVVQDDKKKDEAPRPVPLMTVLPKAFQLKACGVSQLAAPRNEQLSPGPAVCLETTRCDDNQVPNCFDCGENCAEQSKYRNAPIMFTVQQPGGNSSPTSQVVLTNELGEARGTITVDDCAVPIAVQAQVVGRDDPPVTFAISCVNPAHDFRCEGDLPAPLEHEPVGITVLPGGVGNPDRVAVLYVAAPDSIVQVIDVASGAVLAEKTFPGQQGRAIHGYYYEPGTNDRSGDRPVLAVATSDAQNVLHLHLMDWNYRANSLTAHDQDTGEIAETCMDWVCGSQFACNGLAVGEEACPGGGQCSGGKCFEVGNTLCDGANPCPTGEECLLDAQRGRTYCWTQQGNRSCCPPEDTCLCGDGLCAPGQAGYCTFVNPADPPRGMRCPTAFADPLPPPKCGCWLKVEFGTEVSFAVTDLDKDGKNDLAVATSSDLPVVVYYSSEAENGALYEPQGCKCGRFAQAPTSFELLNFGGTVNGQGENPSPGSIDLVIGAPGGAFVKYANARPNTDGPELSCGQPQRVGDLVPVRDVRRGRFQCNPYNDPSCNSYEDVVIVAAKSLGGGSFDDPGTIRIVYGAPKDLSQEDFFDDANSTQELIPKPYPGRTEPKDPRTAQIADFNDDGNDDLAILFGGGAKPEVHIWLGAANRGVGEVDLGVLVDQCPAVGSNKELWDCSALRRFATPDIDGDGRAEVVVICDATAMNARLRWFRGVQ